VRQTARRLCAVLSAAVVVSSVMTGTSGVAGAGVATQASDAWKVAWTAVAPPYGSQVLQSVSCPTARRCIAVGYTQRLEQGAIIDEPLAERWDGSRWAASPVPAVPHSQQTELNAVSCWSSSDCEAVGSREGKDGAHELLLGEHWNGSTWSVQHVSDRDYVVADLDGIACTTATICIAVGYGFLEDGEFTALAEGWSRQRWTAQHLGSLSKGSPQLMSISCVDSDACLAVGNQSQGLGAEPFAERWARGKWTTLAPPTSKGSTSSGLDGVSCVSATRCVAVGTRWDGPSTNPQDRHPFAELWTGSSWRVENTPYPKSPKSEALTAVSCVTASCMASGLGDLVEAYHGSSWMAQRPAVPQKQTVTLLGVDCRSMSDCVAVGYVSAKNGFTDALAEAN
jgi:hypothetical protein